MSAGGREVTEAPRYCTANASPGSAAAARRPRLAAPAEALCSRTPTGGGEVTVARRRCIAKASLGSGAVSRKPRWATPAEALSPMATAGGSEAAEVRRRFTAKASPGSAAALRRPPKERAARSARRECPREEHDDERPCGEVA
eukprot:5518535-Heterocapsa_arctica.AAC.1